MAKLAKLVLGVAAILFGVIAFGSGSLFGLAGAESAGLAAACAGGAALL
jgi:hypothetical protein